MIMSKKSAFWVGGTVTAFLGVGVVKLVAPELSGTAVTLASASGYVMVAAGITLISFATRRNSLEAFITIEKGINVRKRP